MSLLDDAKNSKLSVGRNLYIKYMNGEQLTPTESIIAKCAECMNFYIDGKKDCGITDCPLYPFMPYQKKVKRKKRTLSQETKDRLAAQLKKARENKLK